jgi:hypothetical protein
MPPSDKSLESPLLVQQDIKIERERDSGRVVASAVCRRKGCSVNVEDCAQCAYFARIDVHEAGYVMLCQTVTGPHARAIRADSSEPPTDEES